MSRNKHTAHSVYRSGNYTTVTYWKGKRSLRSKPRNDQKRSKCAIYDRRWWILWGKIFAIAQLSWILFLQVQIATQNTVNIVHAATYTASMISPIPSIPSVVESPKPIASFFPFLKTPKPTPTKLVTPIPSTTPTPVPTVLTRVETPIKQVVQETKKVVRKVEGYIYGTPTGNYYEDYIFQHESGYILNRVNSKGCYGLGQDCNNRLASVCPNWKTDEACQLKYWENYMINRYGSWYNAYQFWIRTDARPYNGHWW